MDSMKTAGQTEQTTESLKIEIRYTTENTILDNITVKMVSQSARDKQRRQTDRQKERQTQRKTYHATDRVE